MKKIPDEGDMRENWECPEPTINISEDQKNKLTMGLPLRKKCDKMAQLFIKHAMM